MEPLELPPAADDVRKEMIALIPDVRIYDEDEKGNKKYGGDEIAGLVSRMKAALNLDETWEGRLRYWSTSTKLVNTGKKGYLIAISDEMQVYPGGLLKGGSYIQVKNEPVLGAGATTLFFVPR
ncbi:hypothetical protein N7534_003655 [Penicillium rubens]|nr:hypothetical protein N7524_003740 [Penicillium chrysogenum]KAJ5858378.1 hypothetical protein N7534_003655 [Penicillium rubens]